MNRSSILSKLFATLGATGIVVTARAADAQPPAAVDVVVHDVPRPRRIVAIEWNPLALIIGKQVSANLVIAPIDHHALVLSPFYASTTTVPIFVVDASSDVPMTRLPQQRFEGFGGEIGYRYFLDVGGPRGFFAGPSLLLASMTATAQDQSQTAFWDYGFAVDAGYEALIQDRVAISLGAGAQYVTTSKSIPRQQWPAQVYANSAVRPRLLVSVGLAF
ncbi:MAG: hypothetical protein M3O46_11960 [Myxococcota bacterium]|nr:hypothetical protein [Myxococcota bacterium]